MQHLPRSRVAQREPLGVQQQACEAEVFPKIFVVLHVAVAGVVDDRVAKVGEVLADLVASARLYLCLLLDLNLESASVKTHNGVCVPPPDESRG